MITVHKYRLDVGDEQIIDVPAHYHALHVDHQASPLGSVLTLWMLVDTDLPHVPVRVRILGTGHPTAAALGDLAKAHVGSSIDPLLGLVWHVFVDPYDPPF